MAVLAVSNATGSESSSHDSGPSSVPFRGSSVPKSRKSKSSSATKQSPRSLSASSYSTWLLLDADDRARPFLSTLHKTSPAGSDLPSGSSSPAARSAEKLTESTNVATTRKAVANSNVRSQASKYENGLNSSYDDRDKRMSLQQQGGSTGKRGFMSRLRAAGGSVSSASAFNAPGSPNGMPTSGSWSIVESPTPGEEGAVSRGEVRTVHLAFTALASESATKDAKDLVERASSSLLSVPMRDSGEATEQLHAERVDAAGLTSLVASTNADAVYIGSARASSGSQDLQPYLEALLSSTASPRLKAILLEPAVTRTLTPSQASALHDLARAQSVPLLLPIRWTSLWTTSIEETLLGLEILHDLEAEHERGQASANNGNPDVSVDKSFDVSMSNIPTGLSGEGMNHVAEVEALKTQLEQLRKEVRTKDRRIADLSMQSEEQDRQLKQHRAETAEADSAHAKTLADPAANAEPKTPQPSHTAISSQAGTPGVPAETPRTPLKTARTIDVAPSISPSTSQRLTAAVTSPSPSANEPFPSLAPAAQIASPPLPPPRSPSRNLPTPSSPSASSSKVIATLTSELAETKSLLESTRAALSTVRTQSAAYQAAADEMRSTLSRARLENDSSVTILARKDRQISEALERARKAESESKELGRASREWGTRIREVEEELGKERMTRSRAEQAYEMLGNEWKTARGRLVEEVRKLKEEHKQAVDGLAGEYQKVLVFKDRLKQESALLTTDAPEGDVVPPTLLVTQLTALNDQMQTYIQAQVQPLLARLKTFEARENAEVVDRLQVLTDELTRIKTLMRRGDVTSAQQVGPSPL